MSVAVRAQRPRAPPFIDPPSYARHRPEATLLYQLVGQHFPAFRELRAEAGRPLPRYVQEEFEAYLKCGRLEEGFLRVRCEQCHAEKLVAFTPAPPAPPARGRARPQAHLIQCLAVAPALLRIFYRRGAISGRRSSI
ncbi:MAG: hypothetical protein FJ171_03775 [Gammaproteobacteria bacterium]|nr:hypothetical protein [Gammaproteobacteria bacterium]